MDSLDSLAQKYGTDKSSLHHGYCSTYAQYLDPIRETARKVLEVGIAGGASLRMWRDYFPNSDIIGVDHNSQYVNAVNLENLAQKDSRIQCSLYDAANPEDWDKIEERWGCDFDVLIDDGYHSTANIIQTFENAFQLVRDGGYYIIEDLHAVYTPDYNRDNHLVRDVKSAVHYFLDLVHQVNEHGEGQCGRQSWSELESVHFHKSLVIIKKR